MLADGTTLKGFKDVYIEFLLVVNIYTAFP